MVEQNFRFAAPLADRFYVMEHGRIVEAFAPARARAPRCRCCTNCWASEPQLTHHAFNPQGDTMQSKLKTIAAACRRRRCGLASARAGAGVGRRRQDRLHHRHVRPVRRHRRPGRRRGDPDGDRRHRRQGARQDDRGARPPTTRTRPTSPPPRRANGSTPQGLDMLIGGTNSGTGAGHGQGRGRRRSGSSSSIGAASLGADQRAVHALHRALRLRHRGAGQGHRRRGGQGRRQELVLPDRRLRLRPLAAKPTPPRWSRPTAARWSARCGTR